jgi:hypothetical protein
MKIETVIKKYEEVSEQQNKLSFKISEHFQPIINKAVEDKDTDKLESLLNVLPECIAKFAVYHGLRIIREK